MNNVKNVVIGLFSIIILSLGVALFKSDSVSDQDVQLIALAREVAMEGETIPVTNMNVHLTTDREYAVVTFTQGGEDYIVNIAFSDIPAGLIDI